jgi:hypothetical protein
MPTISSVLRSTAIAAGMIAVVAAPAFASDLYGEQYHADSFGNLIIYSPAGYKRIVVGQGHVLAEMEAERAAAEPEVIYGDEYGAVEGRSYRDCRYEPGMFKGRSYMYGLPDGVVPTPARRVCD